MMMRRRRRTASGAAGPHGRGRTRVVHALEHLGRIRVRRSRVVSALQLHLRHRRCGLVRQWSYAQPPHCVHGTLRPSQTRCLRRALRPAIHACQARGGTASAAQPRVHCLAILYKFAARVKHSIASSYLDEDEKKENRFSACSPCTRIRGRRAGSAPSRGGSTRRSVPCASSLPHSSPPNSWLLWGWTFGQPRRNEVAKKGAGEGGGESAFFGSTSQCSDWSKWAFVAISAFPPFQLPVQLQAQLQAPLLSAKQS